MNSSNTKIMPLPIQDGQEQQYQLVPYITETDFNGNTVMIPDTDHIITVSVSELNGTIGSSIAIQQNAQNQLDMINAYNANQTPTS